MKRTNASKHTKFAALLAGAALLGLVSQSALAAGTASGSSITNTATLNYSVGAVPQTLIESSPTGNTTAGAGAGTATSFTVDNKINMTVAEVGSSVTTVVPGSTAQVTTFTVTNNGNTVQDFGLAAANVANGQTLFGSTDNFQATGILVFVESGTTPGYQALEDTAVFIDELAPDASATVYVVADIPVGQVNNDAALVSLTATAQVGGTAATQGANVSATVGGNTAGVDVVFGDAAGSDDAANNGQHSARDAFKIGSAVISVQKTVTLLCDPFNGATNPKNIPGSTVQYAIIISNAATASSSATLSTIGDALNANTTFEPNLVTSASACATAENAAGKGFKVQSGGTSTRASTTAVYFTSANDADGVEHNAGTVSAALATALPLEAGYAAGQLKPGESVTVTFNVTVN